MEPISQISTVNKRRMTMKKESIRNAKSFDELLDLKYGKIGTKTRDEHESKANYFVISEILRFAVRGGRH